MEANLKNDKIKYVNYVRHGKATKHSADNNFPEVQILREIIFCKIVVNRIQNSEVLE